MNSNQIMLNAIDTIVSEKLRNASYDKTRNGVVRTINASGTITVEVDGKKYPNVPVYGITTDLKVGGIVKVTYPCNNTNSMYASVPVTQGDIGISQETIELYKQLGMEV